MKSACVRRIFAVVLFLGTAFTADAQDSRPRQNEFDKWHYEVSKDETTDKETFKARLLADAPPRGWFEVEATCGSTGVFLQASYLTGINNEKDNPGTINHGLNKLLVVRMNLDGEVRTARSLPEKFKNAATFQFPAPNAMAKLGDMGLATLADGLASAVSAPNPGTPSELFKARSVKMEIPLDDGSNPVLRIQPQDPEFQKFASRCVKEFPDLITRVSASAASNGPIQPDLDSLKPRPGPTSIPSPIPNTGPVNTTPIQPQPEIDSSKPLTTMNTPPNLAVLTVNSTFQSPNPIAGINFYLMRDDFATTMNKNGYSIPTGADPKTIFSKACGRPDQRLKCDQMFEASKANPAAIRRSDIRGTAIIGPVQPGDYYLLIYSYGPGRPALYWDEKITLAAGTNPFTAGIENSKPLR